MVKSPVERIGALVAMFLPIMGTLAAIWLAFVNGYVRSADLWLLFWMYLATGLGITVGFHRMLTHQSFRPTLPVKFLFLMLGSMALQGPAIYWATVHWKHHVHSDTDADPHSPWWWRGIDLRGFMASPWHRIKLRALAFWNAHMGWLFQGTIPWDQSDPVQQRFRRDALVVFMSRTFVVWVVLRFALCWLIGGLPGMLWGGCVAILLTQQVTYLVNSATHVVGWKDFDTTDESRNNPVVALLAKGEGWHNNHHKFMWSARHGLTWWQFDLSYVVIWVMQRLRLVSEVRLPKPSQIQAGVRRHSASA